MMSSDSEPQPPLDETVHLQAELEDAGKRLDAFLAERRPEHSRVHWRRAINAGRVLLDGKRLKAAYRLRGDERLVATIPEAAPSGPEPEPIPLSILFEDEHLAAIDKPPGMVVHPAKGHWSGTLTSALAHHFGQLSSIGGATRPGIVHRLDRDTSGVIVVAKTDTAHLALARQFEARTVSKTYLAITAGVPDRDRDVVEAPIGPHPYHREKMAIRRHHPKARDAESFYEVTERFVGFALVRVTPKTGRTHQIRLHLAHIGAPVLCDRLYSGRSQIRRQELAKREDDTLLLDRQALHAARLELEHPIEGHALRFEAPLPEDMQRTLEFLRAHRGTS